MTTLTVVTRSAHKLGEIRDSLPPLPGLQLIDLAEAGVPETAEEAGIEAFHTFEENALAKARYFAPRCRTPVIADDSGLCVDALDGAPGVFSKRFSGRDDLSGLALDLANNQHLLEQLADLPPEMRTAHYVCTLAIVLPGGAEYVASGTVDGIILAEPRGTGGFGYDPLFFVPELQATFAEVEQAEKNRISHRGRALQAALPTLRTLAG